MSNSHFQRLKKLIPRTIVTQLGAYRVFNRLFGQNSTLEGVCMDGKNNPIPWITYPAIEFLDGIDFSEAAVFEYGAGSSTLWWSSRAKTIDAVEREKDWFYKLEKKVPRNVQLFLEPDEIEYPNTISKKGRRYDVIVIDGAVRYACAQESVKWINDSGIIVFCIIRNGIQRRLLC